MRTQITLLLLLISFSVFGQKLDFDIYNHSLQDYIQIEKNLGSTQLPNPKGSVSFTKNALPIKFQRSKSEKHIPDLVSKYFFEKRDSTMSHILYEWDVFNFEKNSKNKKSKSFEKAFRKKFRSLEKRITKLFGKPKEVNGDLSDLSKSDTEKGLEKDVIWYPNDSTKIELHSTISNFYKKEGISTFYPDHNIRLFIRKINNKDTKNMDPYLNDQRINTLNNIVEKFIKTINDKDFENSKPYLSDIIKQQINKEQLFSLNNNFDFSKKIELINKEIHSLPNGEKLIILFYKYQNNNKSDTKDKMMKMIFDSKNKVAGIFVSN